MTARDDLKHGQKIRLTVEGYVHLDQLGRPLLRRQRRSDGTYSSVTVAVPDERFVTALEVLEEPKPEWWPPQDGDVVMLKVEGDEHVIVRERRRGAWFAGDFLVESRFTDAHMESAELLVRDGTKYESQWLDS